MGKKVKIFVFIGIILSFIILWWTRYQPIGEIGGTALKCPVVINRFNGKIWIITPSGVKHIEWKSIDNIDKSKQSK